MKFIMSHLVAAIILAAAILSAGACLAAPPPGDNVLGLYSSDDGNGLAYIGTPSEPVSGLLDVYLVASGTTDREGIHGFEAGVVLDTTGEIFPCGVAFRGCCISPRPLPAFCCGYATPLTPNEHGLIVLVRLSYYVLQGSGYLYLRPVPNPSIPDSMVWATGSNPGVLRCFTWSSGGRDKPCFGINTGPLVLPIAAENRTWGRLKSLYR